MEGVEVSLHSAEESIQEDTESDLQKFIISKKWFE
jgi:hypothetical protein